MQTPWLQCPSNILTLMITGKPGKLHYNLQGTSKCASDVVYMYCRMQCYKKMSEEKFVFCHYSTDEVDLDIYFFHVFINLLSLSTIL